METRHHQVNLKQLQRQDAHSLERPSKKQPSGTVSQARSLEPPQNRNKGPVRQLALEEKQHSSMKPRAREQLEQRTEILEQLRHSIFGKEVKTRFGNIVCNAFWGFWPTD